MHPSLAAVLAYLHLRARVLGRQLAELGLVRGVLLGALLVLFVGKAVETLATHADLQWLVPVLGLGSCLGAHRRRTDLTFLHLASPDARRWLWVEYTVLLLPLGGMLLSLGHAGAAVCLLPVPVLATLPLPRALNRPGERWTSIFRSEAFEWVSGFRQRGLALLWLGAVGGAVWQRHTLVPAVGLVGWALALGGCYDTPEPPEMLLLHRGRAGGVLARKLLLALTLYGLTAAPLLYLVWLSPAGGAGTALLGGWGALVVSMVVLAKYAFYPHATLLRLTQGGVVAVALLPLLNSTYTPLLPAVLGGLIWKSRQRLQQHWHD
ncbi:hypothetical protein [Hymenobacter algoricola]|uniref:Chloride channel protein n=1 Tax=Hymenobacter algoricola TaxID=486267 RepID=A0ABP7MMW4_9BACT